MAAAPPRIVLVHGFTQTGASWRPVAEALQPLVHPDTEITAVDAPGHGSRSDVSADLVEGAALLADQIRTGAGPAVVIGYSMGGRLALRLALDHPDAVAALLLVGATAGIDDPDARTARRMADDALATTIEADGVEQFLDAWLAQPLFEGLVPEPDDLAARRANTASGLASSLRLAGTGTMDPPWWDDLHRIAAPTLVAWGERDAKFAALGARLVDVIGPNARGATVGAAGHAAHLEQPTAFAALVDGFLDGIAAQHTV